MRKKDEKEVDRYGFVRYSSTERRVRRERRRWILTMVAVALLVGGFTVWKSPLWRIQPVEVTADPFQFSQLVLPMDELIPAFYPDLASEVGLLSTEEAAPEEEVSEEEVSEQEVSEQEEPDVLAEEIVPVIGPPPSVWLLPFGGQSPQEERLYGYSYDPTYEDFRFHGGIDFTLPIGALVLASAAGKVVSLEQGGIWDGWVILEHDGGYASAYYGVLPLDLSLGQEVAAGDSIGTVLPAPAAEINQQPHLHFEIIREDLREDPLAYLVGME